jgi:lysyl-tRNA synthetase, class II
MSLLKTKLNSEQIQIIQELGLTIQIELILKHLSLNKISQEEAYSQIRTILKKSKNNLKQPKLNFEDFKELLDEGDYIQASGTLNYSKSGEPSLFVQDLKILTKALRPLPEKMDYENFEERYLNRVVDFKMNTKDEKGLSVRQMIKLKSKYWQIWREEMINEGFLEIEAPIFETIPGGAEAKPFTTFYNELNQEVYLRISLELPQKKLIAGGFEKIFEIGRIFRNEGSSPQHLQEYTQIEWYCAYQDYDYGMHLTKKIYRRIINEILGGLIQTDYYGNQINWGEWCSKTEAQKNNWELLDGWPKIPYFEAVRYFSEGKIDMENKNLKQLLKIAKKLQISGIEENLGLGGIMDKIWKKIRVNITNPIFLILPPVELEPLAKKHPDQSNLTQRFQVVAGGNELGKGFSELNDPIDQDERFAIQQQARDSGNEEAQFMDEDYIKALELGTPPMAGFGTSERLFSFLLSKNIKECVTFPHIRSLKKEITKSEKDLVTHIVLLGGLSASNQSKLNITAQLYTSFSKIDTIKLTTIKENTAPNKSRVLTKTQHNILMKETKNKIDLINLKNQAEKADLLVICFTEEMKKSSNDEKSKAKQEIKKNSEIVYLGILIFGEKKKVEELTKNFALID